RGSPPGGTRVTFVAVSRRWVGTGCSARVPQGAARTIGGSGPGVPAVREPDPAPRAPDGAAPPAGRVGRDGAAPAGPGPACPLACPAVPGDIPFSRPSLDEGDLEAVT